MRLPISPPTPLECVLWGGAALAWTVAAGVPGASLLGLAWQDVELVRIDDRQICRAIDPDVESSGLHASAIGPGRAIFRRPSE